VTPREAQRGDPTSISTKARGERGFGKGLGRGEEAVVLNVTTGGSSCKSSIEEMKKRAENLNPGRTSLELKGEAAAESLALALAKKRGRKARGEGRRKNQGKLET